MMTDVFCVCRWTTKVVVATIDELSEGLATRCGSCKRVGTVSIA